MIRPQTRPLRELQSSECARRADRPSDSVDAVQGSGAATSVASDPAALVTFRTLCLAYASGRPVQSVAVVGNAPVDPSDERAAMIDSCDLVFRVNGFALDEPGRPCALGSRTHVVAFTRGVRATPWLFRDYRDRLYLLVEPARMHWEPEVVPDWWPPDLGFLPVPNREISVPLSEALGIDLATQPHWATTGTMAAWVARTLFPDAQLHLMGYSFIEQPQQTSWEHAYGEPCEISAEHLLDRESALLRSWAESGAATVHH